MLGDSLLDLSALAVESVNVMSAASAEGPANGHAMTELAASCAVKMLSTPSFVVDDDLT